MAAPEKSSLASKFYRAFLIFAVLPLLLFSFQNCSPSSLKSLVGGSLSNKSDSGGNGEPYDGKPSYLRLVPGLTCNNQNVAVGSLVIHGDTATMISNEDSCNGNSKDILISQLEKSSFTTKYLGFESGVYTYLDNPSVNIRDGIFTEAWCRVINKTSGQSDYEFGVEWNEATQTSSMAVMTKINPLAKSFVALRKLEVGRVSYAYENSRININFAQTIPGSYKVPGTFRGSIDGQNDKTMDLDCLMGGQFDPIAPKFEYPSGYNRTLAVGDSLRNMKPTINKSTVTFSLNGTLPSGLSFDQTSGLISGKAMTPIARQKLFVSAVFPFGKITKSISIGVGNVQVVNVGTDDVSVAACGDNSKICSLRGAVAQANRQAPIPLIVQVNAAKIEFSGVPIDLNGDVSIIGQLASQTILDAKVLSNHFNVNANSYMELKNLNLINGHNNTGGSVSVESGYLIVSDSTFDTNTTDDSDKYHSQDARVGTGGAIDARHSDVEIYNTNFRNNHAAWNGLSRLGGGAIYINEGKSLIVKGSEFTNNSGNHGGAVHIAGSSLAVFQFENSKFTGNESFQGGAIYAEYTNVAVINSGFIKNVSLFDGGAISYFLISRAWVQSSQFDGNSGAGIGSAAIQWLGFLGSYNEDDHASALYVLESDFKNHSSDHPGVSVLLDQSGSVILRGSHFYENGRLQNCKALYDSDASNLFSLGGNSSTDNSCPR